MEITGWHDYQGMAMVLEMLDDDGRRAEHVVPYNAIGSYGVLLGSTDPEWILAALVHIGRAGEPDPDPVTGDNVWSAPWRAVTALAAAVEGVEVAALDAGEKLPEIPIPAAMLSFEATPGAEVLGLRTVEESAVVEVPYGPAPVTAPDVTVIAAAESDLIAAQVQARDVLGLVAAPIEDMVIPVAEAEAIVLEAAEAGVEVSGATAATEAIVNDDRGPQEARGRDRGPRTTTARVRTAFGRERGARRGFLDAVAQVESGEVAGLRDALAGELAPRLDDGRELFLRDRAPHHTRHVLAKGRPLTRRGRERGRTDE